MRLYIEHSNFAGGGFEGNVRTSFGFDAFVKSGECGMFAIGKGIRGIAEDLAGSGVLFDLPFFIALARLMHGRS